MLANTLLLRSALRSAVCLLAIAAAPLDAAQPSAAKQYPARPVRIVVPFAAGGGTDVVARQISTVLSERWEQQVVVDNRPGGSGTIGVDIVARSTPDGYTLCMITASQTVDAAVNPKLPYDLVRDFEAISRLTSSFYLLNVTAALPAKSLQELIAYAKANPGKLNFGSSGPGTLGHLSGELFASMAGLKLVHVPYKGGSGTATGLATGEIQLAFVSPPASKPLLDSGRIRALAITDSKRSPEFPQLPTVSEAASGYLVDQWYAVIAPKGTGTAIARRLSADFREAILSPRVAKTLAQSGLTAVGSTPEEAARHISAEIVKWRKLVAEGGLTLR
jgi:tripartite-type tricarboxylate transporter receptor subunit TctC